MRSGFYKLHKVGKVVLIKDEQKKQYLVALPSPCFVALLRSFSRVETRNESQIKASS